jgi:iron complex outermembrane receptor protein
MNNRHDDAGPTGEWTMKLSQPDLNGRDLSRRTLVVCLRHAIATGCLIACASGTALAQEPAAADGTTLERIVVTAQSREQELQEVPIAIQVVNDKLIDETTAYDLQDIDTFVPVLMPRIAK